MSETIHKRRMLVGLDLSSGSLAAAELTAEVAAALSAEVCGLFVEEEQLLILAAHPLVREVDTWSATERAIDTGRLERRMRAQGSRARDCLARLAERRGVAWSFQVARGLATETIREASREVDIVVLGRVGWSPGEKRRLGATARDLLTMGARAVMIPGARAPAGAPIVVCCGDCPAAERALAIAVELAKHMAIPLRVKLLAKDPSRRAELRHRVGELAAGSELAIDFTTDQQARLDAAMPPARLIILAPPDDLEGPILTTLVAELSSPVLVIN